MIRIEENPTNLLRKILTQAIRQKLRNDIEPFVLVYCANGSVTPAHIAQILQLYTENFGNNMVMKLGISHACTESSQIYVNRRAVSTATAQEIGHSTHFPPTK